MSWTMGAQVCPEVAQIADLRPQESTRFNPDRLEQLCLRVGEVQAEAAVALALHRSTESLPTLGRLMAAEPVNFPVTVEQIAMDAELMGMASLARAARDVIVCFATSNNVALAATMARLSRVGDRSVNAVWEMDDGTY